MLTSSEVIYAKRSSTNLTDWHLLDIYKVAPHFPMNVSLFGNVNSEMSIGAHQKSNEVELAVRPTTGSRRGNLQGLIIPCGLVVCTAT